MTEKLIAGARAVRSQDELAHMTADLVNLQKLIAVSFQALKGSLATKPQSQQLSSPNNMPKQ
jgi:16S rRNA G527 N7-methylase RsmG